MKTLLAILIFGLSTLATAEICTNVIRDSRGYEWETFTRSSYSQQSACDLASYDCSGALTFGQSMGRYYDAYCVIKNNRPPNPPRPELVCRTDLLDRYDNIVRSFTAPGSSPWDACNTSDNFCQSELSRHDSFGFRCVNRGLIDERNDPRQPDRNRTENCLVNRLDPAGMFIQNYFASATGPIGTDVRGEACRMAINDCSRDLRGRQTCNISR